MKISTVTIIGATGTMGANVSGIFASFGNAKVFMVGRNIEKVKGTIAKVVKSVRADSISCNLVPADFSMLEDCVQKSDLVFESSVEDMVIKKKIIKQVGNVLSKDALYCTGTSGLSITEMAEYFPENIRANVFGVHLFNPPYNMPLCELISTRYSDERTKEKLKKYLKEKLIRTVVEVKDLPAFLGNRIGFQFINEALQEAEKYKENGGIDYIDAILGSYTGRSMSPLVTADFVGLDVHKAIVDNVYQNTEDFAHVSFLFPEYAERLVEQGKLGRKVGEGLYKTIKCDDGSKKITVLDINTMTYRDKAIYVFPYAEKMKNAFKEGDYEAAFKTLVYDNSQESEICIKFLLKYIIYSLDTAMNIGFDITAADDVMATGFNWCPPLAMLEALSKVVNVTELIAKKMDKDLLKQIDLEKMFTTVKKSKYDYRPYFKSGR